MERAWGAAAAVLVLSVCAQAQARDQWSQSAAHGWYDEQAWLVGANYLPATAINQLEMWQAESFDPDTIERELSLAASIGMNTMRVYLHNLLWEEDAAGFKSRMDEYLAIAERHGIDTMFVLFDSVWDPDPQLGPQRPPIPGVHNSGWVQSPGAARLADEARYDELEAYVTDVVRSFAKDERIVAWDVWNEPSNRSNAYEATPRKRELVAKLLPRVFEWARGADPSQPLTSGVWIGKDWSALDGLPAIERTQIEQSDVVSFHDYGWPEQFEARLEQLGGYGRPILCTEYMARGNGSTFDTILPIAAAQGVAMYNWGLVDGKSQTRFPWDSWKRPYVGIEPSVWFHDVFRADGTPYRERETDLIKDLTTRVRKGASR